MTRQTIEIGKLYETLISEGRVPHKVGKYNLIECNDIKIQTIGNKFVYMKYISQHETTKDIIEVIITTNNTEEKVRVTTDHICMVYNDDNFFENLSAKDLKIGQVVSVYDKEQDKEVRGCISNIHNLGKTTEYVYDCEVEDDNHCFYANNILIHNSLFVNLEAVTSSLRKQYNLPQHLRDWDNEYKQLLWDTVSKFIETKVNPNVQSLITNYCRTSRANVLSYELEYLADTGIYEAKKRYAVRKMFDEGDMVDKYKWSGISLKQAILPKECKEFLEDIYKGTLANYWTEKEFNDYIISAYEKFCSLPLESIAMWKGYNTEKSVTGFLTLAKGAGAHVKAAIYYNQLLKNLNIANKYDSIIVGDKIRFVYVVPNNKYKIDCIAYKDVYPEEFRELFVVDTDKMFDKVVLQPLKNYLTATKFNSVDPKNQPVQDIFEL